MSKAAKTEHHRQELITYVFAKNKTYSERLLPFETCLQSQITLMQNLQFWSKLEFNDL